MGFSSLRKKWGNFVVRMNALGVPLPTVRDPKSGIGSVSLTLVFVSSLMVILGLVGKWSGILGIVDINNSLEFFFASTFLYFGRNWKTAIGGDSKEEETSKEDAKQPKVDNPDETSK